MVGLDVELEVFLKAVGAEKRDAARDIEVILVLRRLLGLGLDVELPGEANFLCVVDRHVEEAGQMIEFALHVGVPEILISLAASPEGVAGAA